MAADDGKTGGRTTRYRILCLTGPESVGKTTLAHALAEKLGAELVPEVAREYLAERSGYEPPDLLEIAALQLAAEERVVAATGGPVICDTDLTVIQVWWEEKYGTLPPQLRQALAIRSERAYLLLKPDLSWAPDPLRENPEDRERLYARYQAILSQGPFPFEVVAGSGPARLESALRAAEALLTVGR